jgi:hypothetical protein
MTKLPNVKLRLVILTVLTIMLTLSNTVYAHPGNTAADGCHYCRTNCAKWGEVSGARHCHGGYTAPSAPVYTTPSCPQNSYYSTTEKSCVCNTGYTPSIEKSYCVKVPANAHAVESATDVWECDYGYEEINGSCTVIKVEPTIKVKKETTSNYTKAPISNDSYQANAIDTATEEDGSWALGLITLGGIYAGKKYLDTRKKKVE